MRPSWISRAIVAGWILCLPLAAAAQVRDWPSERPPRPLTAPDVEFPPYEIRTLPNGLRAVAVLHHEQPVVSIRLIVRAGSAQDPSGKAGVAHLAAALLDQGTATRTAQQIADEIDFIGGGLGTGAGTDLTYSQVVVMKDSFEYGLRLLSDVVRTPAFAPDEIERQKQQLLSGLRVSYQDPDYIAGTVFDRLVYGFHPYGMPDTGTPESIEQIGRDDLVAFHSRYFVPNNAIIAVVGDVTAAEAFSGVEKVFGAWAKAPLPDSKVSEPPPPTRRVVVIDRPDAVQTEIRIGHLALPRKHPDYMALNLAVKILGGEGANRLQRVLRSERGLTYGASADMDTLKVSGDIVAETDTRSDATGEVLRTAVDEFWRLQRERVDERELGDAKAYLAGSFPLTIETPDAIAMQVLNALFYELDLKELQTFRERVNAVTPDDVQRVARSYLKPDRLSIVLVGNASVFAGQLRGAGFGEYEMVPLDALDLTSANLRRDPNRAQPAAREAPPEAARERAAPPPAADVSALIARAVAAKGGRARLQSIRTVVASATTVVSVPDGPLNAETVTYIEYPARFRVEAKLPTGTVVQTFADGQAWIQGPRGVEEAPAGMRNDLAASTKRDLVPLLLRLTAGDARVRAVPPSPDDRGRPLPGVEVSAADLQPTVLYIDPDTGFVVKQAYRVDGANGQETQEEVFSDFRPVDGVQVAFRAVVRRGGAPVIERTVTELKYNAALPADLFKRPS
jgi:zinc protease